jgi:hypothetical protein
MPAVPPYVGSRLLALPPQRTLHLTTVATMRQLADEAVPGEKASPAHAFAPWAGLYGRD